MSCQLSSPHPDKGVTTGLLLKNLAQHLQGCSPLCGHSLPHPKSPTNTSPEVQRRRRGLGNFAD